MFLHETIEDRLPGLSQDGITIDQTDQVQFLEPANRLRRGRQFQAWMFGNAPKQIDLVE